jgi:hypothetical protein
MLGSRIARELRNLDREKSIRDPVSEPPSKRRKVIVHSSPYLRCLETSVAIGAGLQEFQPPLRPSLPPTSAPTSAPLQRIASQTEIAISDDQLPTDPASGTTDQSPRLQRTKLRVDAFLGEWLSPSYFERSKPPPSSTELVEAAKEVLEKPAEDIRGADISTPAILEFTGVDWSSKETEANSTPIHEKTGLRAMAAAGHAMAKRPRRSFTNEKTNGITGTGFLAAGYSPPIPTYSIAPREAIPIGYVAHARDACIDFDSRWDTMKEPLAWGDGGPFGEEWSSMHRRFRNGLQKMLAFYELSSLKTDPKESQSEDEDIVLVLVTHQAGCNALIRLLTGAPALHDVGTASLTMAVRREQPLRRDSEQKSPPAARRSSLDLGIAEDFEVKIIASTEHLRGGSNPLGLNSPRLGKSPALASRRAVGADSPEGFSIGDPLTTRPGSGYGGPFVRSMSQRSYATDDGPGPQSGLWRRESTNSDVVEDNSVATAPAIEQLWGSASEGRPGLLLPTRSASQRGMWGGESSIRRDRSPGKRRWTAVDRSP